MRRSLFYKLLSQFETPNEILKVVIHKVMDFDLLRLKTVQNLYRENILTLDDYNKNISSSYFLILQMLLLKYVFRTCGLTR